MFVPRRAAHQPFAAKPYSIVDSSAAPSTIAASTTWPRPDAFASSSAASTPIASSMPPPPKSPIEVQRDDRIAVARADRVERARHGDVVDVVAGRVRERAVLAPAGHPAVDEPRVAREADVGTEPEPLHRAGAEPFDERVGALDHGQHVVDRTGPLQIDRQRRTTARQQVAARVGGNDRRGGSAAGHARTVDAQHVRAEIREHHRAERRRPDADHLDDLQTV